MAVWDTDQEMMEEIKPTLPNGSTGPKTYDDFNDPVEYLKYMAANGDEAANDKLMNYLLSEASSDRARQWTASREDSQYQRLFKDLSALGINPYIMLQSAGVGPVSTSSSGHTYSGSQNVSKENNERSTGTQLLNSLISLIPMILIMVASAAAV